MTEREEVRFKVYNKNTGSSNFNKSLPFDTIDFNIGGSYDTGTYQYTFLKEGTYLIGVSYNKHPTNSSQDGVVRHFLKRDGKNSVITLTKGTSPIKKQTISSCYIFKFEVGDIIYLNNYGGDPRLNRTSVPTGDIYNSWWGIRLDY